MIVDSERVLRRKRLIFLYKASAPAFLFFLVQSVRRELEVGMALNLLALAWFCGSMRTLFGRDNITRASWQYLLGFCILVGFTPLVDGNLKSSVIWLLPLIPVIAAHLLGVRAVVVVACGTVLAVIGTWLAGIYLNIAPEHNFQLYDKVILHQFALLVSSGLGLSAIRAANQQFQVIRAQEEELRRAQEALEAARRAKMMFLANMSHEIRTPLNGILGMTAMMDTKGLEQEDEQAVHGAHSCAEQLLSLLNGVLDLSKVEAGKLKLRHEPYLLSSLYKELHARFVTRFQVAGIAFELARDQEEHELLGDRQRLVQVLSIFLENALQFSDSTQVRLHYDLQEDHDGPGWICWVIQDDGVGMGPALLDHVVSRPLQGSTQAPVGFQGAGLGIDLAIKLVKLMGGELQMESELGQGVTVRMRLPLVRSGRHVTLIPEPAPSSMAKRRAPLRVLLVDDNQVNRIVTSRLLATFDCVVRTADNGAQAFALAARPFDLILMDLQMPVMDGFAATKEIRKGRGPNRRTPIVALTAGEFEDDRQARLDAGMTGFLAKPIDPYELERILRAQGWVPRAKAS